jgi:flagella basal body P-ring formation protein FlgA
MLNPHTRTTRPDADLGLSFPFLASDTAPPAPPEVTAQVRALVARSWGVTVDRITLRWGPSREEDVISADATPELVGSGSGGYWVAAFRDEEAGGQEVRVRIRAGVEVLVPVARRPIERGETLDATSIELAVTTHWGPPPASSQVRPGWVARRSLRAGETLRRPAVEPIDIVTSGAEVDIYWIRGAIRIQLRGRALGTAAEGEVVPVRTDTGTRLTGVAVSPGVVKVELAESGEDA